MELFEEGILKEKNRKEKNSLKLIPIFIIILSLLCIIIISLIIYLKDSIVEITLDTVSKNELRDIFIFNEEKNDIYIPIRQFAKFLEYESYNGEYLKKSEDSTKCYVESKNEVVNLALNSNKITKKELESNSNYETIQLEEPIKEINGELCTNINGVEKIFNIKFYYNDKNITIYTLSYLAQYYLSVLPQYGYVELKEGFSNQKAILKDILIAKNSNEKYGVINAVTAETILEPKYDNIEYLKSTNEFLVTSNNNKGIISYDKEIKVNIEYTSIIPINESLYVINKNENMGMITISGETVIYPKYDYIGLQNNNFKESQGQDDYILLEDLIPVREDKKWAIFKKDGTQVTKFIYDDLGCIINNDKEKENVITIEGYNVFVAQIEGKYYLVTKERKKCN